MAPPPYRSSTWALRAAAVSAAAAVVALRLSLKTGPSGPLLLRSMRRPASTVSSWPWLAPPALLAAARRGSCGAQLHSLAEERPPPTTSKFASRVERRMEEILTSAAAPVPSRVVDSWRYLEMGYEHRAYVGTDHSKSPETSNCHQYAHSHVPGLTVRTFWDVEDVSWRKPLEAGFGEIREEFLKVISDPESLALNAQNPWVGAQTEDARSYGAGWKTLGLLDRGIWDPINVRLFPKTSRIIKDSGIPAVEAFFASMDPKSEIKLHSDNADFLLTAHLPLVVPENGNNKCRMTVGDEAREWLEGRMMMFDTSIMHAAANESNKKRYILMFRLWHPDLAPVERKAIQFALDSLSVPELVSEDPREVAEAERQVMAMRSFPDLRKSQPKVVPPPPRRWKAAIGDDKSVTETKDVADQVLERLNTRKKKFKKKKTGGTKAGHGIGFGR